jgi:hypothetical protein
MYQQQFKLIDTSSKRIRLSGFDKSMFGLLAIPKRCRVSQESTKHFALRKSNGPFDLVAKEEKQSGGVRSTHLLHLAFWN